MLRCKVLDAGEFSVLPTIPMLKRIVTHEEFRLGLTETA